jgi:hypothetical protein
VIGARTIEHLTANLKALEIKFTAEQLAKLDAASKPVLNFPAAFNASLSHNFAHAGATVNGVPGLTSWPGICQPTTLRAGDAVEVAGGLKRIHPVRGNPTGERCRISDAHQISVNGAIEKTNLTAGGDRAVGNNPRYVPW